MKPSLPASLRAARACFTRELRVALLNRFVHVFSGAALLAGIVPLLADRGSGEGTPYFLLQALLYLVPLFGLLIGAGAAQSDQEERPFLLTQPVSRRVFVAGKFCALTLLLAGAALLLVLPAAVGDVALAPLAFLWLCAAGAGAVFVAAGLACGFATNERVKAHLAALCVWLLLLAGFDLAALAGAHLPFLQARPGLWTSVLMLNPLDALRVGVLFRIDQVPFDTALAAPLVRWWLTHPGLWFATLTLFWTTLALAWSARRLDRSTH